jgi:hypothetical protein
VALMGLGAGTRLGPYEIQAPLGAGGMGEVYRARDTRLRRDVAIKVLPAAMAASREALARFEAEALAVAALSHPNILALYDVGIEQDVSYAVLELLDGETLRARVSRDGRLPLAKALDYGLQFARGLAAAHERGFVHRDIKPENLFLTRDGRAKILDFGIAVRDPAHRRLAPDETVTADLPETAAGTAGYMAPEQIRGEPATFRSDLFALGVVMVEMIAGANPFRRETVPETLTAVLREQPPSLARVGAAPPALGLVIERCLEKLPADRPESTRDLALFFEAQLADRAAVSGSSGAGSASAAVQEATRRLHGRVTTAVCAALLGLTLVAWALVGWLATRAVAPALAASLDRAAGIVQRVNGERLAQMHLTARLVASFPELKALFDTDPATVRDYLLTYQQRNPGTPVLVALDRAGRQIARTDTAGGATDGGPPWLEPLLASDMPAAVLDLDGRPHHVALAPAEAGGTVFGFVAAASPVDGQFAQTLREATAGDTIILAAGQTLASTLRPGLTPWQSLEEWRASGGHPDETLEMTLGPERVAAREIPLAGSAPLSAVVLAAYGEALVPFQSIRTGILLLGAIAAAVVLVAGRVLPKARARKSARGPQRE